MPANAQSADSRSMVMLSLVGSLALAGLLIGMMVLVTNLTPHVRLPLATGSGVMRPGSLNGEYVRKFAKDWMGFYFNVNSYNYSDQAAKWVAYIDARKRSIAIAQLMDQRIWFKATAKTQRGNIRDIEVRQLAPDTFDVTFEADIEIIYSGVPAGTYSQKGGFVAKTTTPIDGLRYSIDVTDIVLGPQVFTSGTLANPAPPSSTVTPPPPVPSPSSATP